MGRNPGKYDKNIRDVRKKAREIILEILKTKPRKLDFIFLSVLENCKNNFDNKITCQCGKQNRSSPEWKHQVRWAIQDLKYNKKLNYDKESGLYSLNKS